MINFMNSENGDFGGRPTVTANKSPPSSRALAYPGDKNNPSRVTKPATEFMMSRRRDRTNVDGRRHFKCC